MERETFEIKRTELKKAYEHSISYMNRLKELSNNDVCIELNKLEQTRKNVCDNLEKTIKHAKSNLSTELAEIQLMYCHQLERILTQIQMSQMDYENQKESQYLLAEYAIDNAIFALQFADYEILQTIKG